MTPAEVIAMRDKLARFVGSIPPRQEDIELADDLIKSGWVTAPPRSEKQEVCGKVFRTYEFSYTCPKRKGHEGECDD